MQATTIEGTTALVTGANRGIGRAIAQRLLERGAARVTRAPGGRSRSRRWASAAFRCSST